MRLVKCKHCGEKISNVKSYKIEHITQKTKTIKHYCSEDCYKLEEENKLYRKRVIGIVYDLLNVKVKDNGALINKKLKEIDCYTMKKIYETLEQNIFEFSMYVPSHGSIYGRVCYLFAMLKNILIDEQNVVQNDIKQHVVEDKKVDKIEFVEEQFTPMKRVIKRNGKKIDNNIDLDF